MNNTQQLIETVRRERAAAREREVAQLKGARMELGYTEGGCTPFRLESPGQPVTHGILCGGRAPRHRCQVCKTGASVAQCDYPTGKACRKCKGKGQTHIDSLEVTAETMADGIRTFNCYSCAGTGRAMCNKHLCRACRGHLEPDEDYCPDHRVAAGLPPLIKREPCQQVTAPMIVKRKCLRESCTVEISADEPVLYFPRRRRAMCASCGEEYLRIAQ